MEQNAKEIGGSEGCFVFASWLVGDFDFMLANVQHEMTTFLVLWRA